MQIDDLVILALMAGLAVAMALYVRWRRRQRYYRFIRFASEVAEATGSPQNVPSTETPGRSGA